MTNCLLGVNKQRASVAKHCMCRGRLQAGLRKVSESARAATTNLFTHSSGGQRFKIKVLAHLVSGESSLPGLQLTTFSLCPHMAIYWCSCGERPLVSLPLKKIPVLLD